MGARGLAVLNSRTNWWACLWFGGLEGISAAQGRRVMLFLRFPGSATRHASSCPLWYNHRESRGGPPDMDPRRLPKRRLEACLLRG